MPSGTNVVTVEPTGIQALSSPNFIIEGADGVLYLTVAVLEYDERAAGDDAQKKEGVATVRRMFEHGVSQAELRACQVGGASAAGFAAGGPQLMDPGSPPGVNTDPPGVNTNP